MAKLGAWAWRLAGQHREHAMTEHRFLCGFLIGLFCLMGASCSGEGEPNPELDGAVAEQVPPELRSVPSTRPDPVPKPLAAPQVPTVKVPPVHFNELPQDPARTKVKWSDFVGSEACADCHPDAYDEWKHSTHGRAGGYPTVDTVIPQFDEGNLKFTNGTVTLRRDGDTPIFQVQRGTAEPRDFPVVGVVGRGLIYGGGGQAYFTEAPDGRWLLIPLEYNVEKKVWFCQTTGHQKWSPIDGTFPLEACGWPPSRPMAIEQGPSCQNCHASQVDTQYVPEKDRIETRVQSFSINCESCHGPAKVHVERMKSGDMSDSTDIGFEPFAVQNKRASMAVCMACHGNKPALRTDYLSGDPLDAYFAQLTLWPVGERKIDFDGRTIGFAYQQGHLYSDCFVNGSMTCVDCHSPHSNDYRDVHGQPLTGRFDDGQCTGCHPSKGVAPERHHRHETALQCTDCHMPFRQHDTVGQHIRMLRSDHAIPIPRPGSEHGEKACRDCHVDRGIPWSSEQFTTFFGELKPYSPLVAGLFRFQASLGPPGRPIGSATSVEHISALVADLDEKAPIVSIAAMSYLVGEILSSGRALNASTLAGLWRAASSDDIDVAGASMATILLLTQKEPAQRKALFDALAAQPERREALRLRLVFNLIGADHAFSPLSDGIRQRIRSVMEGDGQQFGVLRKALLPAVSMSYLDSGDHEKAMDILKQVVDDPYWSRERYALPLLGGRDRIKFLMAMTESERGQTEAARVILEDLLDDAPRNVQARGMLCQIYEGRRQWKKALDCLQALYELDPESTAPLFYQAKILKLLGRHAEALYTVEDVLKFTPDQIPAIRLRDDLRRILGR